MGATGGGMTRVVLIVLIVLVTVLLFKLVRQVVAGSPPKPPRRCGWLDDDGAPRGERWDGSWLSGPRTALSLA